MSVDERTPEPGEPAEQMKERQEEYLKEIDKDLERVDGLIHEAEEKAKKKYKLDQD
jgi:hypothetical protein